MRGLVRVFGYYTQMKMCQIILVLLLTQEKGSAKEGSRQSQNGVADICIFHKKKNWLRILTGSRKWS